MAPLATVGILSIGEMGMGIAQLLIAHNYRVVTNVEGRSPATSLRVQSALIEPLPTDESLVEASDYILSIVPPRDALSTATRITTAFNALKLPKRTPLYYLDLNAIAPRTARSIETHITTTAPLIKFLDGGIIGGAPALKPSPISPSLTQTTASSHPPIIHTWSRPSIPISGPHTLHKHLTDTLNINHISPLIGPASGLKCCFATATKGLTALAIQAFTTAEALGVLPLLKKEMGGRLPDVLRMATWGVEGMPPKAYRWVREMEEISLAHTDEGGFTGDGKGIFDAVAEVYKQVAEDTVLGEEKTEERKRGRTIEDVAVCMGEGLRKER